MNIILFRCSNQYFKLVFRSKPIYQKCGYKPLESHSEQVNKQIELNTNLISKNPIK